MSMLALKLVTYKKRKEAGGLIERALEVAPDDPQVTRYVAKYLRKQVASVNVLYIPVEFVS